MTFSFSPPHPVQVFSKEVCLFFFFFHFIQLHYFLFTKSVIYNPLSSSTFPHPLSPTSPHLLPYLSTLHLAPFIFHLSRSCTSSPSSFPSLHFLAFPSFTLCHHPPHFVLYISRPPLYHISPTSLSLLHLFPSSCPSPLFHQPPHLASSTSQHSLVSSL